MLFSISFTTTGVSILVISFLSESKELINKIIEAIVATMTLLTNIILVAPPDLEAPGKSFFNLSQSL